MSIEFYWRLPTSGDGHYGNAAKHRRGERDASARPAFSPGVSDPRGNVFNYFDHLHQIARAVDLVGFDGLQIPNDPNGDESWIVAGYLARGTRHIKLLTEFEASRGSAVFAAKNAAVYQRYTGGRFAWQINAGGNARQRRWYGDFAGDSDLLPRIDEFVTIARGVLSEAPYSFKGRFFEVKDGGFQGPLSKLPLPPVFLSGDSDDAYRLSARIADVHLFDALAADQLAHRITRLQTLSQEAGRQVSIGLRLDVLARETEKEALFDARRHWEQTGSQQQPGASVNDSNLWAGLTTSHTGATASLVGSYEQVVARLADYANAGVTHFVLAATPHYEEAWRVGEHVLPELRAVTGTTRRLAA